MIRRGTLKSPSYHQFAHCLSAIPSLRACVQFISVSDGLLVGRLVVCVCVYLVLRLPANEQNIDELYE